MKHVSWYIGLLAALLVYAPVSRGQNVRLPSQLQEYYSAYNYAVAFSTPAERSALVRFSSAEVVRDSVGSERLARVYEYMQEVTTHEIEVDPGVFTDPDKPRDEWYHSSNLVRIHQVHQQADEGLIVEVTVYQLDEQDNLHFIEQMEDDDLKALGEQFRNSTIRTFTRYHQWTRSEGTWRKTAVFWQLLGSDR